MLPTEAIPPFSKKPQALQTLSLRRPKAASRASMEATVPFRVLP